MFGFHRHGWSQWVVTQVIRAEDGARIDVQQRRCQDCGLMQRASLAVPHTPVVCSSTKRTPSDV